MKTTKFNFDRHPSQYLRVINSIPLYLSEGAGGFHAHFKRYLQISENSIKECVVYSTIARRKKYITEAQDEATQEKLAELSKMANRLQKYLKSKK